MDTDYNTYENEILKYIDGQKGWFNFQEFYEQISKEDFNTIVEVGVWKGHSISFLAHAFKQQNKHPDIYAVDLFDKTYRYTESKKLSHQLPLIYDIYNEVLTQNGVRDMITDLKGYSWEMADYFDDNSIDFVFIDADHEYESVVKDIKAWYPKVKSGGIISGHDYGKKSFDVQEAVDDIFDDVEVITESTIWYKRL